MTEIEADDAGLSTLSGGDIREVHTHVSHSAVRMAKEKFWRAMACISECNADNHHQPSPTTVPGGAKDGYNQVLASYWNVDVVYRCCPDDQQLEAWMCGTK